MKRIPLTSVLLLAVAALLLSGCGGGESLDTVKVSGTVTKDGTPLDNVTVTFIPDGAGNPATGETGSSGKYSLTTTKSGDGAVPGSYKVSVKDVVSEESVPDSAETVEGEPPVDEGKVPGIYHNPESSGLTAKVEEGKENTFDFDLKSGAN